jgi:hypothetical protein
MWVQEVLIIGSLQIYAMKKDPNASLARINRFGFRSELQLPILGW